MKTELPDGINNVEEAKIYLDQLILNEEIYHPEEDAFDIVWRNEQPTEQEAILMNKLMYDIYNLPQCQTDADGEMEFDPCAYIIDHPLTNQFSN
jgi:hypothetical protein